MFYKFGLIGYPVGHSLSPKLQNAALRAAGLEGEYKLYRVEPTRPDLLKKILEGVRKGEMRGLNVTIPHKQTVIPMLDVLTPVAQAIGAVNVIYAESGKLIGDNTDAPAFLADLKNFLGKGGLKGKSALVLGAGGSARAVIHALLGDEWRISIYARRREQAQKLIDETINARSHYIISVETLSSLQTSLIINTTPVGMTPCTAVSPWPEDVPFPEEAAVYDLIYNPRETLLVTQARAAGLCATTGVGMLIEQAALAFEIWTGYKLPRAVLWNAVNS